MPAPHRLASDKMEAPLVTALSATCALQTVVHDIGSAHGGHRISFVHNTDGEWWRCSDSVVTALGANKVYRL